MLRVLSDLTITGRIDVAPAAGVTDYRQGQWVLPNGVRNSGGTLAPLGCIFNMTDTDAARAADLSADTDPVTLNSTQNATIGGADKLTVIAGPFRGVTDQISTNLGTPVAGTPLTVVSGLLNVATISSHVVVAVCEEVVSNFEHRGETIATAWRFKTV